MHGGCALVPAGHGEHSMLVSKEAATNAAQVVKSAAANAANTCIEAIKKPFQGSAPEHILTTPDVLGAEYNAIWRERKRFASEDDYRVAMRDKEQAALCLSGGGIRSAAFALGVLQALAKKRLLTK